MPNFVEEIAANFVLSAFAAIQCDLHYADTVSARLQCEHAAVFVIGMRNGVHQAGRRVQTAQRQLQTSGARIHRQGLGINPR